MTPCNPSAMCSNWQLGQKPNAHRHNCELLDIRHACQTVDLLAVCMPPLQHAKVWSCSLASHHRAAKRPVHHVVLQPCTPPWCYSLHATCVAPALHANMWPHSPARLLHATLVDLQSTACHFQWTHSLLYATYNGLSACHFCGLAAYCMPLAVDLQPSACHS